MCRERERIDVFCVLQCGSHAESSILSPDFDACEKRRKRKKSQFFPCLERSDGCTRHVTKKRRDLRARPPAELTK